MNFFINQASGKPFLEKCEGRVDIKDCLREISIDIFYELSSRNSSPLRRRFRGCWRRRCRRNTFVSRLRAEIGGINFVRSRRVSFEESFDFLLLCYCCECLPGGGPWNTKKVGEIVRRCNFPRRRLRGSTTRMEQTATVPAQAHWRMGSTFGCNLSVAFICYL